MDWKKYLLKTPYKKEADRLVNAFRIGKIVSYDDLQNAPIRLGAQVCGFDVYGLVRDLNQVIAEEKSSEIPSVSKAVAASAAAKPTAGKKAERSKAASEAGKRTGSRPRQDAPKKAEKS